MRSAPDMLAISMLVKLNSTKEHSQAVKHVYVVKWLE